MTLESTQRNGENREESTGLGWKVRLALPGWGRLDGENKAVRTKAEFPLKARILATLSACDRLLIIIT